MSSSASFNETILADKLSKLNATQQSIETLSHWCIFHRKRASQIVATWQKEIEAAPAERKLPLLYLANDILQNSRKKGPEFMHEFWGVLPPVVQELMRSGPEGTKKSTLRMVDIWEDRKVFGPKDQSLRVLLLADLADSLPPPATSAGTAATVAAVAAAGGGGASGGGGGAAVAATTAGDGRSGGAEGRAGGAASLDPAPSAPLRGPLERIASVYATVQEASKGEEAAVRRCSAAINELQLLERQIAGYTAGTDPGDRSLAMEKLDISRQMLASCKDQMTSCERKRGLLVKLLTDALKTQESKLERLRSQLEYCQASTELASRLRVRLLTLPLTSSTPLPPQPPPPADATAVTPSSIPPLPSDPPPPDQAPPPLPPPPPPPPATNAAGLSSEVVPPAVASVPGSEGGAVSGTNGVVSETPGWDGEGTHPQKKVKLGDGAADGGESQSSQLVDGSGEAGKPGVTYPLQAALQSATTAAEAAKPSHRSTHALASAADMGGGMEMGGVNGGVGMWPQQGMQVQEGMMAGQVQGYIAQGQFVGVDGMGGGQGGYQGAGYPGMQHQQQQQQQGYAGFVPAQQQQMGQDFYAAQAGYGGVPGQGFQSAVGQAYAGQGYIAPGQVQGQGYVGYQGQYGDGNVNAPAQQWQGNQQGMWQGAPNQGYDAQGGGAFQGQFGGGSVG